MITNIIPITVQAPLYNQEHIGEILSRIKQLHPTLKPEAAKLYLCDLLNIADLDEITGDFLNYYELEPAVSSAELHKLANRILSYNDHDMDKSIFAARNILNTIPKTVDDLIDYVTKDRLKDFITSMSVNLLPTDPDALHNVKSLDVLIESLKEVPQVIIDLSCNAEMDKFQSGPIEQHPGLTHRQQMLYATANYYLNHLVGFKCNSMWLAAFIGNDQFGCHQGWIHGDGTLCDGRHFGFRSLNDVPKLVASSQKYIQENLDENPNEETCMIYLDAMLSAMEILTSKELQRGHTDVDDYITVKALLDAYSDRLSPAQLLRWETIQLLLHDVNGVTKTQFHLMQEMVENNQHEQPQKQYLIYFDAWNFLYADFTYIKSDELPSLFLKSQHDPEALRKTAKILLDALDMNLEKAVIDLFIGFFTGYLWKLVNDSEDQFLYDAILDICKDSKSIVDNKNVVIGMAELGHKASMQYVLENTPKERVDVCQYWKKRIQLVEDLKLARISDPNKLPVTIGFFDLVTRMEHVLDYTTSSGGLVREITKSEFLDLRAKIIEAFQVGVMPEFKLKFGDGVEFGDVSDACREVTFSLYPQGTPMEMPITITDRKKWCSTILKQMDNSATGGY
ncbi:hypothetical protein [Vibrio alginolyticus]|uniref:hypothetical protein n=1 Tax=Vibrio alginolyticus TaxID=663 RepID=UPI0022AAA838|nr:hypothetical protein [Vibrio alginolyticus]MCZ2801987.1 hypothetical protein [Vibrio alginolyticus]